MKNASFYIEQLDLQPHPEGGYYKEVYRDEISYPPHNNFKGDRNYSTSIYYLLERGVSSSFHRIKSDEIWHHYDGGCILIHYFENDKLITQKLGKEILNGESPQIVVPKNTWFAAEPEDGCEYALMGCTVAPGFDFSDFEMAKAKDLQAYQTKYYQIIDRLTQK
jgi:predicted cupin superfamily sugar epimerase